MKIVIFGKSHQLEELLIIAGYVLILIVLAILIWKLISPFLAIIVPIFISYLLYLRRIIVKK